jgi:hypothetical protein
MEVVGLERYPKARIRLRPILGEGPIIVIFKAVENREEGWVID